MLCLVRSFYYTPHAMFSEEFLLALFVLVFVRNFSYTPHASSLMRNNPLAWPVYCDRISLAYLMLVQFVRSFSCTPRASFSEEVFLHS